MNKERMLQLADRIEKLPAHKFDMANWACDKGSNHPTRLIDAKLLDPHQCKTAGCIAGWAVSFFAERGPDPNRSIELEAQELLNLTNQEAWGLFYGNWKGAANLYDITKEQAAAEIRRLANAS